MKVLALLLLLLSTDTLARGLPGSSRNPEGMFIVIGAVVVWVGLCLLKIKWDKWRSDD